MAVSGHLHTFQEHHAIKEAVVSFQVLPKINTPMDYRQLLDEGFPLHGLFHKFEPVKQRAINVKAGLNDTVVDEVVDTGFKMIAFKNGKTSNAVQALPQDRYSVFTFNTVDYEGWRKFKDSCIGTAKAIAAFKGDYVVKAFSLMYIDEFYFDENTKYNAEALFNLDSRNLPKGIEDSDFVDFNFNLKRHKDGFDYFENFSIKVFDEGEKKTIRIIGNLTFEIAPTSFIKVLDSEDLNKYLDFCHTENKNKLKDILNPDTAKLINL